MGMGSNNRRADRQGRSLVLGGLGQRSRTRPRGLLARSRDHRAAGRISTKTVERALDRLETNGFLKRTPRYSQGKNGGRTSDLIVLCLDRENGLPDNLSRKGLTDNLSDLNRQSVPNLTDKLSEEPKNRTSKTKELSPQQVAGGLSFEDFWKAYPNKRGKAEAKKLWAKLSTSDRQAAFDGLSLYKNTGNAKRGFIRDGDRYLRTRVWEDFQAAPEATKADPEQERVKQIKAVAVDINRKEWVHAAKWWKSMNEVPGDILAASRRFVEENFAPAPELSFAA